ncbi:MAG: twin-arginine translocase TatA/TatE family subunit [Candidatus Eisenbacteria bacterium]|nr:twin-arginine translocase TatA/TatE family subunit [Candidatus Eisenbacteria bacterium]
MFGIGTQEFLVILLFVLLLFGGKRLPEVARAIGSGLRDFRKAMREVQQDVGVESILRPPPGEAAGKPQPPRRLPSRPSEEEPAREVSEVPPSGVATKTTATGSGSVPAEEDESGSI